jgi:hypothetical protein
MSASIQLILNQQISYVVNHLPSGTYNLPDDSGKLAQEILIGLGLITRSSAPPTFPPPPPPSTAEQEQEGGAEPEVDADAKSDGKEKKARTRTVSKKMKDAFLATGKTEDDLKRVIKAYKAASDADITVAGGDFVAFATHTLSAQVAPAPKTPEPKKAKAEKAPAAPKKEKKEKGRVAWSAAEKKVFKELVPNGEVTDELKADFEAYVAAKSDEDFKAFAMAGHMRTWADSKKAEPEPEPEAKCGNGEFTPAEYDIARGMAKLSVKDDDDEEEDLEEIEVNGEQLLIGLKTGDLFTPTSSGDIKIGRAGEGKFSSVSIPVTSTTQ